MDLALSTQYYLKAFDYYPYNLEFTIENLQYALSYDPEHPQALCLLGQVYMYHLKSYNRAKWCFQQAIASDGNYPDSYRLLGIIHVWLGEYEEASRLLDYAYQRPGHRKDTILQIKAMLREYQGEYVQAKLLLKQARLISQQCDTIREINADLSRLKKKLQRRNKSIKNSKKARMA